MKESVKQVIILNKALKMSHGKSISQACHASHSSAMIAYLHYKDYYKEWMDTGQTKVSLLAPDETALRTVIAQIENLPYYLVVDQGRTQIPEGSVTVLGVLGPEDYIDLMCSHFKLY